MNELKPDYCPDDDDPDDRANDYWRPAPAKRPLPTKKGEHEVVWGLDTVEVSARWAARSADAYTGSAYRRLAALARWLLVNVVHAEPGLSELPMPDPLGELPSDDVIVRDLHAAAQNLRQNIKDMEPALRLTLAAARGELDRIVVEVTDRPSWAMFGYLPQAPEPPRPAPAPAVPAAESITDDQLTEYAAVLRSLRRGKARLIKATWEIIEQTGVKQAGTVLAELERRGLVRRLDGNRWLAEARG